MDYFVVIFTSLMIVYGVYMLACAIASAFGKKELQKADNIYESEDEINIYAQSESLEYYIRCALMASNLGKVKIIVNIDHNDKNADEMVYIAKSFKKKHPNLTYYIL